MSLNKCSKNKTLYRKTVNQHSGIQLNPLILTLLPIKIILLKA